MTYSFPLTVTYDWKDEEVVYQFVKALDEHFPLYKSAYPALANWERKKPSWSGLTCLPPGSGPIFQGNRTVEPGV